MNELQDVVAGRRQERFDVARIEHPHISFLLYRVAERKGAVDGTPNMIALRLVYRCCDAKVARRGPNTLELIHGSRVRAPRDDEYCGKHGIGTPGGLSALSPFYQHQGSLSRIVCSLLHWRVKEIARVAVCRDKPNLLPRSRSGRRTEISVDCRD
ncbi:hypothetical protein Poly21_48580 [Allorhodopirellula heiligendammensis]|uniref:Uncharacterized protein n=1 Tax=Allorhodopirellula heiligendammensis TaxID=2714739 RepID=A0A5C6BGV4_9BACT|nr:hypothetical protein Poly21_48580 [Allorhodopirellula heiligendammensis]